MSKPLFINSLVAMVSMKKDAAKRRMCKSLLNTLGGIYYDGIDESKIDISGYLVSMVGPAQATYCAKMAKNKLFNYFINQKYEYLVLLEDDIYPHIDLFKNIDIINTFLKTKPMLLYFGVINNYRFDNKKFTIKQLHDTVPKTVCAGAYSVIIHRDVIPYILSYIRDPVNQYNPFDITCLGNIQKIFYKKCFITDPPMFIPDLSVSNIRNGYDASIYYSAANINKNHYIMPIKQYIFIDVVDVAHLPYIKMLYKSFCPLFNIIYMSATIKGDGIIMYGNINNFIKTFNIVNYYIVVTSNTIFKYNMVADILDYIDMNITKSLTLYCDKSAYFMANKDDFIKPINKCCLVSGFITQK